MNYVANLPSPVRDELGRGSSNPTPRVPADPFLGCDLLRIEIEQAAKELADHARWIKATVKALEASFKANDMVQTKMASEHLKALAQDAKAIMPRKINQIEIMAGSLANTFGKHIRREVRNDRV